MNTWPVKVVADHTVRAVCEDCNNGWMKRWEDAAAPLVEPMNNGQPAQLTVDQQLIVATWAAMKAAVFEYAWSEDTILTAADRDVIRTEDRPAASVQVRLAAIELDGSPLRARGVGYVDNRAGEKIICLTLVIGCLVVQIFGGPGAGTHGLQTLSLPRTDRIRIFPPATGVACRAAARPVPASGADGDRPGGSDRGTSGPAWRPAGQAAGQSPVPASGQRDDEALEANGGNDAAVAAYRLSVQAGNPLSERRLAEMFGRTSRRWARRRRSRAGRRFPCTLSWLYGVQGSVRRVGASGRRGVRW